MSNVDLETAAAIADTLESLSASCTLIAERVSQVDARNESTLKLVAALADRIEQAAAILSAHGAELDALGRRLGAGLELLEAVAQRLDLTETKQDRLAAAVYEHVADQANHPG